MKSDYSVTSPSSIPPRNKVPLHETPIAIVGMGCIFPKAANITEYWKNIINKVDCITDIPSSHWKLEDYYNPDPKTSDRTYCKRGGFLPEIDFDSFEFGLPPNILEVTDVSQLLSLVVAKQAMEDAGYGESRPFDRSKTGVILGIGGGQKLITPLTARLQFPIWKRVLKSSGLSESETQTIIEKIKLAYIGWEENSFPGMLGNVIAGRIANRLDLGGINCVVDAACASSLAALQMAASELASYRSDMMITGGVDTDNSIFMYMCFSKTPAFSKQQQIRPFDRQSDGMLIGEGIGMIVLKRLEDAKRDGDRIYATIRGIGTSSDGKHKSIYAPHASGQAIALRRAYTEAGFSPASVGLIEAHGTGTVAGDPIEFVGLQQVFSENNSKKQSIALGSVKSQIGHTKAAAGIASLIKVALSLHHKILPPTLNIKEANPKLQIEDSPFYLNTETLPWFSTNDITPRRAGVSSFGFGGTNFHVALEEAQQEHSQAYRLQPVSVSILLHASTPLQLLTQCQTLLAQFMCDDGEEYYQAQVQASRTLQPPQTAARVGFFATDREEACKQLQTAIATLQNQQTLETWEHPQGIYYRAVGTHSQGKVVALFSGQGSQYLDMGKELGINFPQFRQAYSHMNAVLQREGLPAISSIVFPPLRLESEQPHVDCLQRTENAQSAIAAFSVGLYKILQQAGFIPDFVAGHSFGELTALWAANALSDEDYFSLVKSRGQAMSAPPQSNFDAGAMLALQGEVERIVERIKPYTEITIANWNAKNQVVIAGKNPQIAQMQTILSEQGYRVIPLPVSAAFHTPLVGHAQKPFAQALKAVTFHSPTIPIFSNTTASRYPEHPDLIRELLSNHLINPVRFKEEIEQIYAAGGSIFVEFGPRNILTQLVKNILEGKPHVALALNSYGRKGKEHKEKPTVKDSDRLLREAVIQLRVIGLPLQNIDPYALETPKVSIKTKPGLTVKLNGTNYVSEKTKTAFEQALQHSSPISSASIPTTSTHPVPIQAMPSSSTSYQQDVLASVSQTVMQIQEHQKRVAQVHEQYLQHQAQYSQQFLQLIQHQYALLARSLPASELLSHATNGAVAQPLSVQLESTPNPIATSTTALQIAPIAHQTVLPLQAEEINLAPPPQAKQNGTASTVATFLPLATAVEPPQAIAVVASPASVAIPVELPQPESSINEPLIDLALLTTALLEVVSERTGYPVEMLEPGMDMEADLGIDSIKRVEILGAMQERFPNLPAINSEELAELRSLQQIVEYMGKKK